MSVQKPLFWQQGLFLQPQHFQLQEQSFRGLLAPFGRFATPHFWGVGDLEIRKSALPNRILDVHRGTFMFPDGTWVDLPGNAVIRARSFDESWAGPLKVYLGLKVWNDSGENVTVVDNLENTSAVTTRYAATADPEEVNDLHAGGPVGRVKRLHYVLKLLWEHEIGEAGDYVLIPLCQLAKAGAEVRVSEEHIPPSLSLGASETLTKLIVEIRDQVTARGRQLEEYKKKRGVHSAEFGSRDMVYILALRSINRYVPLLHHCTETRDVHPWAVYGALRQLVGELSSFSERVNALGEWVDGRRVVPLYDHRDLWGCFATLQDLLSHLMDEITAGPEYIIRLIHDGTSYAADLRPAVFEGRNRFYLALRTEANPQDVLQAVKTVVKLGSREDMRVIVARALPGIALEQQLQTPKELPYRSNTLYFAVGHHSEMWESVMKNRNVALYWASAPEDLEVELMVVGRS